MFSLIWKFIFYIILFSSTNFSPSIVSAVNHLRDIFQKDFHDSCDSYSFVKEYYRQLENPSGKFIVFVYHEPGLRNGGLGDRLAGLITATAIALRLNRTLLIESANGFDSLFRPYHEIIDPLTNKDDKEYGFNEYKYTYSNWTSWTKYNQSLANNDLTEYDLWDCINMNHDSRCGLDDGDVSQNIIKLRGNRAYLCRWSRHPEIQAYKELQRLGLYKNEDEDLFKVGGCMLRLALWPTDLLWKQVEVEIHSSASALIAHSSEIEYRVGAHFRCGDHQYIHPGKESDDGCIHDADGTNPHSESSYMQFGTPVDIGKCANKIYANYTSLRIAKESGKLKDNIALYVASDSSASASQMAKFANFPFYSISPHGCHIQLDSSPQCTLLTTAYWLILALSDVIVVQTENGNCISAFSRYAAIYGLKKNPIRNSKGCDTFKSSKESSRQPQGNWFC